MKKMQQKSKRIQYTRGNISFPSNQAIRMANTKSPLPPPRKSANREATIGLVKMSANCLSVSMYLISICPFSTWSLRKWCLLSRCLILLWKTRFLATEMAVVLSLMRGTLLKITPKSLMVCTIHRIWE
jgi:hypothetical protein